MTAIVDRLSDRTLRRAAWGVALLAPAMTLLRVLIRLAEPTLLPSWQDLLGGLSWELVICTFPLVGLLILRRQPRNTIGWVLQGIGLVHGLTSMAGNYSDYGLRVEPGSVPGPGVAAALVSGGWAPEIGLMGTFLILLYPDGHLPSPRWRPVAWLAAASITVVTVVIPFVPGPLTDSWDSTVPATVNPLGIEAAKPLLLVLLAVFLPLIPLTMVACAVAVVLRYRRSHGMERLQLKWLATAGAVIVVSYVTMLAATWLTDASMFSGFAPPWLAVLQIVTMLSFVLLPTAIGAAILRHNLYGIDVVINRTLVYVALTVTLLGTYVGSVLVLQLLLNPLAGDSNLAVVCSTLAVATVFRPARRSIQNTVDRHFYRRKYDAARTLDDFAVRLRHEVDLDAVGTDLCAAAENTVQPTHVSLWIRP